MNTSLNISSVRTKTDTKHPNVSSRKYERNACFYLWIYRIDSSNPEIRPLPINTKIVLPISNREYKVTLKNVKAYLTELFQIDDTLVKVEIERATHIGSFEKSQED